MNSPTTELNPTQIEQEYIDTDDPSSKNGGSEKDINVHPGPAGTPVWAGPPSDSSLPVVVPHPHQHTIQPIMVDPLSLRYDHPCQSTQCQLTYIDYLLEPQSSQYHLLTGPVPGPPDSSHHNSVSAPWFTNEPILCSMMPGGLHAPVASVCAPQAMGHQQFQEGLTEYTSYFTQPLNYRFSGSLRPNSTKKRREEHKVECEGSGGGQVVPVNPCEPGPVLLNLKTDGGDSPTQEKDVCVLGTPSQFPQYHQTACPLHESRDQTADMQSQAPTAQTVETLCHSKSRKPCHCIRSQCLKLYCECFANGAMCSSCGCSNCHNNAEHEMKRYKAVKSCLGRNPDAFRSKIPGWKSGESKGCNCKRSGCLKNYCECYEANIMCTPSCKCVGCRNYDNGFEIGLEERTISVEDKSPVSVMTLPVVGAVHDCLLARAERAEREAQSPAEAEHTVLEEFGHCLTLIVKAMFK